MPPPGLRLLLGAAALLGAPAGAAPPDGQSLVLERVEQGRGGHRAGLREGDALLAWSRAEGPGAPAKGVLTTPGDLAEVENVQAPLGTVTLDVARNAERLTVTLDWGEFGLVTRPHLSPSVLAHYERGRTAAGGERANAWREAAQEALTRREATSAFWLLLETGRLRSETGERDAALSAFDEGQALAGEDRVLKVQALEARSRALQTLGSLREADQALQEALRLREPDGLSAAAGLEALGALAYVATDLAAERFHTEALRIREALAPGTLVHARSLRSLGNIPWTRGDFDAADTLVQRALGIAESREPGGRTHTIILLNVGNIALGRGRFHDAAAAYRRIIDLREAVDPWSYEVCAGRANLGLLTLNRGELETAEQMFERSYACLTKAQPGTNWQGGLLQMRGIIAAERGEFAAARQFHLQSLEAIEKTQGNPSFPLRNLGEVALKQGDLPAARGYFERALAIDEKKYGKESVYYAEGLEGLADVALRQGDLTEARAIAERAVATHEKTAPGGLGKARGLQLLGRALEAAHDRERAQQSYQAALDAMRLLVPGTYLEAEALHSLGRLRLASGAAAEAEGLLRQAVDAMENSALRAGGGQEARASFRARHAEMYRDLIAAELQMGRMDEAMHVVERSRGRVLLEWLARRTLSASLDVPPELEREREENDAEYERVQAHLQQMRPEKDSAEMARLVARLRELQQAKVIWAGRLRERSPRYAALQYPIPLDAAGVARALDPGTVLLSYVVGPRATQLFVLGAGAPRVYTIAAGTEELQRRITAFRERIGAAIPGDAGPLRKEARALFELLLAPAEAEIAAASRVLVCADGPLHLLPFAALRTNKEYVVEWRPLHFVNSATVYAELQRSRRASGEVSPRLVAFGDPRPHPSYASRFPPLPAAREEVRAVQRQLPAGAVVYLGTEAAEGKARALGAAPLRVHFASHAHVDERFPLDSALVLSPGPGEENGLLQAWEIFDGVRLDADLVTLSACETALGKEMGGEGLLGLTRAFFYAGARSVLASLWSVSDKTTPDLMRRFYRHLARGAPKDQALRAAQVEMIRAGGSRAHPFRWAAFQVFGDWR